ncbi:MAG: hypothetical protein AW08_02260 [Candidatus Accumulibacter adjunctus]|uniref:Uncharacterized protein n=1 Tax=Candidatus Accumulibacter adjunctus TaxID=1454001 RepID=A0A011MBQ3_9PROT|nr:MAG: hypothetical protein AW08_02260 [Candidatus Accumulibacter adjunctus]
MGHALRVVNPGLDADRQISGGQSAHDLAHVRGLPAQAADQPANHYAAHHQGRDNRKSGHAERDDQRPSTGGLALGKQGLEISIHFACHVVDPIDARCRSLEPESWIHVQRALQPALLRDLAQSRDLVDIASLDHRLVGAGGLRRRVRSERLQVDFVASQDADEPAVGVQIEGVRHKGGVQGCAFAPGILLGIGQHEIGGGFSGKLCVLGYLGDRTDDLEAGGDRLGVASDGLSRLDRQAIDVLACFAQGSRDVDRRLRHRAQ